MARFQKNNIRVGANSSYLRSKSVFYELFFALYANHAPLCISTQPVLSIAVPIDAIEFVFAELRGKNWFKSAIPYAQTSSGP